MRMGLLVAVVFLGLLAAGWIAVWLSKNGGGK